MNMTNETFGTMAAFLTANKAYLIGAACGALLTAFIMKARGRKNG